MAQQNSHSEFNSLCSLKKLFKIGIKIIKNQSGGILTGGTMGKEIDLYGWNHPADNYAQLLPSLVGEGPWGGVSNPSARGLG